MDLSGHLAARGVDHDKRIAVDKAYDRSGLKRSRAERREGKQRRENLRCGCHVLLLLLRVTNHEQNNDDSYAQQVSRFRRSESKFAPSRR